MLVAALALAPHGGIAALAALALARVAHVARRWARRRAGHGDAATPRRSPAGAAAARILAPRPFGPSRRLQYTCAAGALASAALAVALGAGPLVASVGACGAVVAFLSGLPAIGGAVLAAGAVALAGGGELALAAGLIAAGIAAR